MNAPVRGSVALNAMNSTLFAHIVRGEREGFWTLAAIARTMCHRNISQENYGYLFFDS
jgi:hypothetical protein